MSYIGNQPVLNTSEFREEFAVTSTQTVFNTGGFTASSDSATLEVLRNGVLLGTADYTLGSDASTVTLANAAVNGDIIVIKGRRELTNGVQVTERRHEHTMGSGETTVTFPYPLTVSQTDVYLNGVKLGASDFSINSSTRVVSFTTNPAVGDLVAIVSREPALTANSSLPVVDASGNNVLSESGGVVTLTADAAVIEGSSSGDLVRITQTGTGNALVVEDSANPDSTPFVVNNSGNLLVGATSGTSSNRGKIEVYSTTTEAIFARTNSLTYPGYSYRSFQATGGVHYICNWEKSDGTTVGTITHNNTSASYNTASDYRLKENITEITDGITRIKQLNPSRFNFIADPDKTVDGFIAHEVQDIIPEAITGEKDAVNEDGSIIPQGIDQSKLVPLLTAALQESIALIESQQSQIDALTARIEALENQPN